MTKSTCKFSSICLIAQYARNAIDGVKPSAAAKGNGANGGSGTKDTSINDSFNKHYNKELKVSEGNESCKIVSHKLVCGIDRRDSACATWIKRECPHLYLKRIVWKRFASITKGSWCPGCCRPCQMWTRWVHCSLSVLQYGNVLLETRPTTRMRSLSTDLYGASQLQKLWFTYRQKYLNTDPQTKIWMSPAFAAVCNLFSAAQAQRSIWIGARGS